MDDLSLKINPPDFSEMGDLHAKTIEGILDIVRDTVKDEKVVAEIVQSMEDDMKTLFDKIGVKRK